MFNTIVSNELVTNAVILALGLIVAFVIVALYELIKNHGVLSKTLITSVAIVSLASFLFVSLGVHKDSYDNPVEASVDEAIYGDQYTYLNIDYTRIQQTIQRESGITDVTFDTSSDYEFFKSAKEKEYIKFSGINRGEKVSGFFYYGDMFLVIRAVLPGDPDESVFRIKISEVDEV